MQATGRKCAAVHISMLVTAKGVSTCQVLMMFLQILSESTREAMRLGLTEKFLAEGQPETGKNGHVLAAVSHRC